MMGAVVSVYDRFVGRQEMPRLLRQSRHGETQLRHCPIWRKLRGQILVGARKWEQKRKTSNEDWKCQRGITSNSHSKKRITVFFFCGGNLRCNGAGTCPSKVPWPCHHRRHLVGGVRQMGSLWLVSGCMARWMLSWRCNALSRGQSWRLPSVSWEALWDLYGCMLVTKVSLMRFGGDRWHVTAQ